jgi:hypothetical protein
MGVNVLGGDTADDSAIRNERGIGIRSHVTHDAPPRELSGLVAACVRERSAQGRNEDTLFSQKVKGILR